MVHGNTDNNAQEENIPIKELKTIFPDNFLWGISTSSYQVEGAVNADKRGRSIWDTFSHTPGKTADGATGDTACDQYHRYEEDIALMRTLGVKVYNFSIAWPRIYPEGKGQVNLKGIDYYRRLIEALQRNNIQPVITLYHWDLPQSLQDLGGWEIRDTAKHFSDYAQTCYQHLAQYIPLWCTLNEPWCDAFLGHLHGIHAPGKQNRQSAYSSTHHLLYAHGLAVQAFRDGAYPGKIGIKLNLETPDPASNSPEDRQAADCGADEPSRLFLNPLFAKAYPGRLLKAYPHITIPLKKNDEKVIATPIDFLGMNYYTQPTVAFHPESPQQFRYVQTDIHKTAMGWDIVPKGLLKQFEWVQKEYGPIDVYLSENGAAFPDILENTTCNDTDRIAYLHAHISMCAKAIEKGVPLKGYFLWSFIDNFEWSFGYTKRFGIVYCDYKNNRKRIPKKSFYWYKKLIR